jgi:hypothetical protein
MMATITHTQTRSLVSEGAQVAEVVTATTLIEQAVFVYRQDDGSFSHVASVRDMAVYPAVSTPGVTFFRNPSCTRVFPTVHEADAFATFVREQLKRLTVEWDAASLFIGSTTETI